VVGVKSSNLNYLHVSLRALNFCVVWRRQMAALPAAKAAVSHMLLHRGSSVGWADILQFSSDF